MFKTFNTKGLNQITLVGEVVDLGLTPRKKGFVARVRLKLLNPVKSDSVVYLDTYAQKSYADFVAFTCEIGNIVYMDAEFRNKGKSRRRVIPYVLITKVVCLRKQAEVKPPSTDILDILDKTDPVKYKSALNTAPKRVTKKRSKEVKKNG